MGRRSWRMSQARLQEWGAFLLQSTWVEQHSNNTPAAINLKPQKLYVGGVLHSSADSPAMFPIYLTNWIHSVRLIVTGRGEKHQFKSPLWRFSQWDNTCDLEGQGGRGCRMSCPIPQMVTAACYSQRTTVIQFGCLGVSSNDLIQQLPNSQGCATELHPVVQSEPWGTPPGLNFKFLIYVNLNLPTVTGGNLCTKWQNPAHTKCLLGCTTTSRHFEKQKLDMDLFTDTTWWLSQEERVSQGDDRG